MTNRLRRQHSFIRISRKPGLPPGQKIKISVRPRRRGPSKNNRFTFSPWTLRRARSSSSLRRYGSRSPWHHSAGSVPACWPQNRHAARASSGPSCPGSGPIQRFQSFPCGITALQIVTTRIKRFWNHKGTKERRHKVKSRASIKIRRSLCLSRLCDLSLSVFNS